MRVRFPSDALGDLKIQVVFFRFLHTDALSWIIIGMDRAFYYTYATHIIDNALCLGKDDVLAINTEEENIEFARILAEIAKEKTDSGTYLMLLENGKKGDVTELFSDYVMQKSPTAFIYLQSYRGYDDIEAMKDLDPPALQRFRLLSSPMILEKPNIVFATVPCPSDEWGRLIDEDGDIRTAMAMISDLLGLGDEDSRTMHREIREMTRYDNRNLNREAMHHCHIETFDGMTDLDFNFLPRSSFRSFEAESVGGRLFIPALMATCHARPVAKDSANGHVSTTRPFLLFGRTIRHLTLSFEGGRVTDFDTDEASRPLLDRFFALDEDNARLAELIVSDENGRASGVDYCAYPEWDRMRTTHITLGQAHSESIEYDNEDDALREGAASSLSFLTLPVGNDEMTVTLSDGYGNECIILEDGMIKEDY